MGFKPEEKVKVKLEFMRMLIRMKLDPARMELLAGFFETYLKLNEEEEEQYYRELGKLDRKEVEVIMQITTSWHEKGRAEGEIKGKAEKAREVICKYLDRRFGEKTKDLQQKSSAYIQSGNTGLCPGRIIRRQYPGGSPGHHQ